jgi:hypothetical protein
MAKGSAELSEFAPAKFEPMIDAGAAKLSAVLTSCKHLAMFMHAGQPKCPNLAACGPMQIDGIWCIAFGLDDRRP